MALAGRLWGQRRESFISENLQQPSQMSDPVRPGSPDYSALQPRWILRLQRSDPKKLMVKATDCHVEELATPAVATFSVFIQPCLTLTATICWNIVVYEEERQVYGLLLDAQLLPLAADQPPQSKDVTCQQLPRCHMARWLNQPLMCI